MSVADDWIRHRRDDGELVGWIRPEGAAWVAVDLLGREASGPAEWLDAEAVLEERGIGYLADAWILEPGDDGGDGGPREPLPVRIVEVTPARIVVKQEDFGAVGAPVRRFVLPWPIPARLRARRTGDPDGFTML